MVVVTTGKGILVGSGTSHPILHMVPIGTCLPELIRVLQEVVYVLRDVANVRALIDHVLINILKFAQGFDDVGIGPSIRDDLLRASTKAVVQDTQGLQRAKGVMRKGYMVRRRKTYFEDMSPILASVIQTFVQHLDDFCELKSVVRHQDQFGRHVAWYKD